MGKALLQVKKGCLFPYQIQCSLPLKMPPLSPLRTGSPYCMHNLVKGAVFLLAYKLFTLIIDTYVKVALNMKEAQRVANKTACPPS